jgi:hypothetical protein
MRLRCCWCHPNTREGFALNRRMPPLPLWSEEVEQPPWLSDRCLSSQGFLEISKWGFGPGQWMW